MAYAGRLDIGLLRVQGVLEMWRRGTDLRARMSKTAFYRTRQELLTAVGVDIASAPPKVPAATEIASAALDPQGWDPEPLEGYAWNPEGQRNLV